ncbi:hypothetical protein PGTUg99_007886 [Puccinia graminis f. sp. tritici]|uniref:BRCT domain-containing protein n=1 Tax=Puccinia graminis f. sp. tritici TaxID=56615 RepID=A0A5B0PLP4_PUCGR|nr:hypothetical protein PGTUg99_007886 [Puccinia graminis f. sp. tritici]
MSRLTRTRSTFLMSQQEGETPNPQQSTSQSSESNSIPNRPIRMIKTRSMSSAANPKPTTIAFGGHVPPKQTTAQPKPATKRNPKLTKVNPPTDDQNQKQQQSTSDRRPTTRQRANPKPKPSAKTSNKSPVVLIEPITESNQSKKAVIQPTNLPSQHTSTSPQAPPPQPIVIVPSLSPQTASTSPQTAPTPTVIIPSLPSISKLKAPQKIPVSAPKSLLCDPPKASCSSTSTTLPPADSLDRSSHSHLPRLIPPAKVNEERPRKRLFEDVDNSSNDIFSFLDHKPQPKKPVKPATRQVFKTAQSAFLKNAQSTSQAQAAKNKHRVLASTKLLTGAQPQAKKLKKTHLESSSTSLESQISGTLAQIEKLTAAPGNSQPQPSSTSHHKSQLVTNSSTLPTTESNEEKDPSPRATPDLISPPLDQPVPNSKDEREPASQDSHSSLPVEVGLGEQPPSNPAATHVLSPVKRAFEATSIQPLPPTLSPTTHHTTPLDPSTTPTQEISADAIDFLSPNKHDKQSSQPETNLHERDNQAPRTNGTSDLEQDLPHTSPPPAAIVSDHQDSNDKNEDRGSQSFSNENTAVRTTDSTNDASVQVQNIPAHPTPPNHSLSLQSGTSELPGSSVIPPDPSIQASTTSDTESISPQSSSDPVEPPVHSDEVLPTSVARDITPPPIRAATPEPNIEVESTTPKPSPKFIPTRTSPIKYPTLPTSIPIMNPQPSAQSEVPLPGSTTHQPLTSRLLIEQAAKRPSMLPRKALKPSMGTSQPLTFNVIPSLDAIIENSPEKKPVRDALSAASLNRPRGFGAPSRMFLGGGMKSKADGIFSRPPAGPNVRSNGASGGSSSGAQLHQELFSTVGQQGQVEGTKESEHSNQSVKENAPEEDDASVDTSTTSIATHHSSTTDSSMTSSSEPNQPQFSGNISLDTQDRLMKLQNMLTKMGRSETAPGASSASSDRATHRARYREYEVPLKDEPEETRADRSNNTAINSRSRRRSSSVPLNYAEDNLSRSVSRAHNPSVRAQPKAGPPAQRRASNILPSVRPDISSPGQGSSDSSSGPSASKDRLSASVSAGINPGNSNATKNDRAKKNLAPTPLKDVVAFVDVRTREGDDAGKVFVEMLKGLGAKVLGRLTFPLTHIIFKAGKPTTLDKYMHHPRPKPALVGIGWVVRCREIVGKAEERPYAIDISSAQALASFNPDTSHHNAFPSGGPMNLAGHNAPTGNANHRRKSMEPKALSLLNSGLQLNQTSSSSSSSSTTNPTSNPDSSATRNSLSQSCISKPMTSTGSIHSSNAGPPEDPHHVLAQSIEKARRKSLQFLPKVGSPLANKVFLPDAHRSQDPDGDPSHPAAGPSSPTPS